MGSSGIRQHIGVGALSLAALACSGCTVLGFGADHEQSREVRVEPDVLAWILADSCRALIPGTESRFNDARVQVYQSEPGSYRLHFRREEDGSFRVATNGRIQATSLRCEDDLLFFNPGIFVPDEATRSCGAAGPELLIEIEPHPRGSSLRMEWTADRLLDAVAQTVLEDLRMLESCATGLGLASTKNWSALASLMSQEDQRLKAVQQSAHALPHAVIKWYLATAYLQLGKHMSAREEMAGCLLLEPGLGEARSRLIKLDSRLNRSPAALRGMQRLIASQPSSLASYMLESRFRKLQIKEEDLEHHEGSEDLAGRVRSAIELGDFSAAKAWLDRCFAHDPDSDRAWRLKVELARASREFRDAFSAGLAIIASKEASADEVLETCLDGLRLGDPVLGLRHLARHWARVQSEKPRKSERVLERLLSAIKPSVATRVLAMERVPELLGPELSALAANPSGEQGGLRLYAELEQLRLGDPNEDPRADSAQRPGFQNAPGVAPAK